MDGRFTEVGWRPSRQNDTRHWRRDHRQGHHDWESPVTAKKMHKKIKERNFVFILEDNSVEVR
jgi:hypothetical protein